MPLPCCVIVHSLSAICALLAERVCVQRQNLINIVTMGLPEGHGQDYLMELFLITMNHITSPMFFFFLLTVF